jgi:primosomal protein N' (replication factor Y) (superfamily II helicase)
MTSAGSSAEVASRPGPEAPSPGVLSGPVDVCVDRPLLSLDRAFTYELPAELGAGVGSLVQVPFHGRNSRGWVLGSSDDAPPRLLEVRKLVSPARAFDERGLALLRWVAQRYVAPLASVIGRAVPPRVASEEAGRAGVGPMPALHPRSDAATSEVFAAYVDGDRLVRAIGSGEGAFVLRPAPEDEAAAAVAAVNACLAGGRRAIVIVPEASPLPATAVAVREAFGEHAGMFVGGDARVRYRTWLDVAEGAFDVVIGTRPAVFAPLDRPGLIYVARESHTAHREDRAPYYHVRDVALTRVRADGGVCVLAAICPSAETAALALPTVAPKERRWPPVEVVKPGPEGRAPRLVRALGDAERAFVFSPLPGYGVAQVCTTCREPAACAACGGLLRAEGGAIRCVVCGAEGRCRSCGARTFGVRRGGAERVEEWAGGIARVPVHRLREDEPSRLPGEAEILIGGPDDVRDLGVGNLDLVAILDADLAGRRPGLSARERSLTTWMEAVGWARPRGRAIVQATAPRDPTVQALVRGNPDRFHRDEADRRREAGLPLGAAVFRITGSAALEAELSAFEPWTLLVSLAEGRTVCLLALDPERVAALGKRLRELATEGVVDRVEAEPHL